MKLPAMIALALAASASPAAAADLLFTLSGDASASFVLDQNPVPDAVFFDSEFRIGPTDGTYEGAPITFSQLYFFAENAGGAFAFDSPAGNLAFAGAQLFSGTVDAPSFVVGTYSLVDYYTGGGSFTLTIGDVVTAVPEPASWAMMIAGFGLVGGALRRTGRAPATA